jgi:hypothetical protein
MDVEKINEFIDNILKNIEEIKLKVKDLEKKEITKEDVEKDTKQFEFVKDELKDDKDFVISILKKDPLMFKFVSDNLKNDYEVSNTVYTLSPKDVIYSKNLDFIGKKEVMMPLIKENGLLLEFVADNLKEDYEMVIIAVSQNNEAKQFISPKIKEKILSLFE